MCSMVAAPHTDRGRLTHVVAMIRNPYQLGRVMCDAVFTNLSALCPAHQVALACFRLCRTDQSYTVHHPHPYCNTTAGRPCLTKGKHPPRLLLPLPLRVLLLLVLRVLLLVLRCVPPSAHPSVRPRCSMRRSLPPPSLPPSFHPALPPSIQPWPLAASLCRFRSLATPVLHPSLLGRLWWDQAVGPGRRAEPRAALAADERPHRLRRCEARRVPLAVRARGAVQEGQADVPMDHRGLLHENGTPIVRRSGDVVPADVANAILLLVHSRAIGAAL